MLAIPALNAGGTAVALEESLDDAPFCRAAPPL